MHALVTGASAGIGEAIAKQLALAHYDLTLVARREAELERVVACLPERVRVQILVADLAELDAIADLVERAEATFGPIDVLINNAGVQIVAPIATLDLAAGERLLSVNLLAPLRLILATAPGMVARARGTIVNIASLAALAPTPGMIHYSASKAGLAGASEALHPELRRHGVHVVTVYPGPVQTAMASAAVDKYDQDPLRGLPVGTSAVLARRVQLAIERRRARVVYPRLYWTARWFPTLTSWVMNRLSPIPSARSR